MEMEMEMRRCRWEDKKKSELWKGEFFCILNSLYLDFSWPLLCMRMRSLELV